MRARATWRRARAAAVVAALGIAGGCGPRAPVASRGAAPRAKQGAGAAPAGSAAAGRARGTPDPARGEPVRVDPARTRLGVATVEGLDFSIAPSLDGRSVLLVSRHASDRIGWVRSVDGESGALSPLTRLDGEEVVGAVSLPGGGSALLTSRDGALCVLTMDRGEAAPRARACTPTSALAVAAVMPASGASGSEIEAERLALIEIEPVARAGKAKAKPRAAAKPKKHKKTAKTKPRKKKKKKKSAGARRKRPAARKHARKARRRPPKPPPRPKVEVRVRFASLSGEFDEAASATGLRFRPPLKGMDLIGAAGRPGAIDLLHYDVAPKRRSSSPLGSARMVGVSLGVDGKFDPAHRAVVIEGDLEYGYLRGYEDPRIAVSREGAAVVALEGRGGACEAARFAPALQPIAAPGVACLVDPGRLALAAPISADEAAALEQIRASGARRVPFQPAGDPGVAGWAGDRAYFQIDGALYSAARRDGRPRREEPPFPARRARIAWGAFAPDGEGLSWAAGGLHRVTAGGAVETIAKGTPAPATPATPATPAAPGVFAAGDPDSHADRRRAARIGGSWWVARGDVVRLLPSPLSPPDLRGRAHPDATSLVGGADRGLFLELSAGRMAIAAIDATGAITRLRAGPAPVRAGFDACERRGGGAIVAGRSTADPDVVVALAVDAGGRAGAPRPTSLPVAEGDFIVRLIPLPEGGALLTDEARRFVVWLDNDGAERAARPWPEDDSGALCVDGYPARREIPSPAPGEMARVPELATPGACVVGETMWAPDGSLRWFGSTASGLDARAEAGLVPSKGPRAPRTAGEVGSAEPPRPTVQPAGSTPAASAQAPPAPCPADMVAIEGGRYCIDRFESALFDAETGAALSPDYPPTPNLLEYTLAAWATDRERVGDLHARALPLPLLPPWQRGKKIALVARARYGARPNGYATGLVAESACAAAGKRLCTLDEFVAACRGEDDTQFPYGDSYEDGACNVFRYGHPAAILHGNASIGHLDPRLNRARLAGEPLLRETGTTPRCASRWGSDAAYDLVGNLDEWVDEPGGAFAGGFYSRSTRAGCEALVTAHPRTYADYSTGIRCCRDGSAGAASSSTDP